jgi:hypothetical protein
MLTPGQSIPISENVLESRMAVMSRGASRVQVCSEFIDDVQRGAVPGQPLRGCGGRVSDDGRFGLVKRRLAEVMSAIREQHD